MEFDRSNPITVLVVESRPLLRYGLRHFLAWNAQIYVVADANLVDSAIAKAEEYHPQVALVGLRLSDGSGIDVCRAIRDVGIATSPIILSPLDWDVYVSRAWCAGAIGFLAVDIELPELVRTIRRAAYGERLFTDDQIRRVKRWQKEVAKRLQRLTLRELEVLHILATGSSNPEIAEVLIISKKTVETHVRHILGKLEMASRREVMIWLQKTRALAP